MSVLSRILHPSPRTVPAIAAESTPAVEQSGPPPVEKVAVGFRVREASLTIWIPAEATPTCLDEAAIRLRSWAAIRECSPTGPAFVRFEAGGKFSVHLPIEQGARPHPETGVSRGEVAAGPVATVECTCLEAVSGLAGRLRERLAGKAAVAGVAEFHAGATGFREGTLLLPLVALPRHRAA